MKSIALYFETSSGKYLKNLIIGVGAGVVLVGALFKIEHLPGASIMLTIGMCTEAFIFVLLGLLPPHKDYYWEKYYPGLDENPHVEAARKGISHKPTTSSLPGQSATASLDKMMEDYFIFYPLQILSKRVKFESIVIKFVNGLKNKPAKKYFRNLKKKIFKKALTKNQLKISFSKINKILKKNKYISLNFKN
jgi:hypothetical protein